LVRLTDCSNAYKYILRGSEQLSQRGLKSYPGIMSSFFTSDSGVLVSLLPLLQHGSDVGDNRAEDGRSHYRPRICCQVHEDGKARRYDIRHNLQVACSQCIPSAAVQQQYGPSLTSGDLWRLAWAHGLRQRLVSTFLPLVRIEGVRA
jgi:hypothetical protein